MKKQLCWLLVLLTSITPIIATEGNIFNLLDWGTTFSAVDKISNVFGNLGNFIQLIFYAIIFWTLTVFFFASVWFIFIWLPIKIYPSFVQIYNIYHRLIGTNSQL